MRVSEVLSVFAVLFYLNGHVTGTCYWNSLCPYPYLGTKTPYDTARGDIRDLPTPENCTPVSVWALLRHGNRNPGSSSGALMKSVGELRDEIVQSYEAGTSELCAQDVEDLKQWQWDPSIQELESELVEAGREELYAIGNRIQKRFPHLLDASADKFYFKATEKQRAIDSGDAFLEGLAAGTPYNFTTDTPSDDVIKPYSTCERFDVEVKNGPVRAQQEEIFLQTPEFLAVKAAVQKRLGISHQLSSDDINGLYDKCRHYQTWNEKKRSAWCAAFTDDELEVLEYGGDVDQFYSNGYGSWMSARLGEPVLKDLYESFQASVAGQGKNIISYFSHNSMMHMAYCALGLYKDPEPLFGDKIQHDRLWRSSENGVYTTNIIAVLNRCQESTSQSNRVQLFVNEKVTELCPVEGCTWAEFQAKFEQYGNNLDFCSMEYRIPEEESNGSFRHNSAWRVLVTPMVLVAFTKSIFLYNL